VRISVTCPECESQFQLEDTLRGKSIKCPSCGEIFLVPAPSEPEPDDGPAFESEWSAETIAPLLTPVPVPAHRPKTTFTEGPSAEEIWKMEPIVAPPKPKNDGPTFVSEYSEPEPEPLSSTRRTKKKKGKSKAILLLLFLMLLASGGVGGYYFWKYQQGAPNRLWADSQEAYSKGQFDQSRKLFSDFATRYPSDSRTPEARFFTELSNTRAVANSVLAKSDPNPSLVRWKEFLVAIKDPELAPFAGKTKFGLDIWQTGVKLSEDVLQKGEEVFNQDTPDDSEKWLKETLALLNDQEAFRPDDVPPSDMVKGRLTKLQTKIDDARVRLKNLAQLRTILNEIDENTLAAARDFVGQQQLTNDATAREILESAEKQLQGKVKIETFEQPISAVNFTPVGLGGMFFAPRLEGAQRAGEGPGNVWFACAKGILYAFEENGGRSLWACRVGPDHEFLPSVSGNLALVVESSAKGVGLSGRDLRSGTVVWHLPLNGVVAASPIFSGTNVYVLMRDAKGTIYEIDSEAGEIVAKFELGRRAGPGLALGTDGRLYVPAESQGIIVFEINARKPDGNRAKPSYLGTIRTRHTPGSLLLAPSFIPNVKGTSPLFILVERTSAQNSKLKLYRLGEDPTNAEMLTEYPLSGWLSSPPICNGETIAFATDRGEFHLLGINLIGNKDRPLFKLSSSQVGNAPLSRGFIARLDESSIWVCAGGVLHGYRQGFNPEEGFQVVPRPNPQTIGEPLAEVQTGQRNNRFLLVSQMDGMTFATSIDAASGVVLWKKTLGVNFVGQPIVQQEVVTVQDQQGGVYRLSATSLPEGNGLFTGDGLMVAAPVPKYRALNEMIPLGEDALLALAYTSQGKESRLLIRHITANNTDERSVPLMVEPQGTPSVIGKVLFLPLADGTVARIDWSAGKVAEIGPVWRNEKPKRVGQILPLNETEFFTYDGLKGITRYQWGTEVEAKGKLDLPVIPSGAVRLSAGMPNQLLIPTGSTLALWNADTLTRPALKTWTFTAPVTGSWNHTNAKKKPRILANSDKLRYFSPEQDAPLWEVALPKGKLAGEPTLTENEILWPLTSGEILSIDLENGESTTILKPSPDLASPTGNPVMTAGKLVVSLREDGTVLFQKGEGK